MNASLGDAPLIWPTQVLLRVQMTASSAHGQLPDAASTSLSQLLIYDGLNITYDGLNITVVQGKKT